MYHQRHRFQQKYSEVIVVFVSRLQKNTRAADVERHVPPVFGLRLKSELFLTKYDDILFIVYVL